MALVNSLKRTNSFIRFLLVGVVNTLIGLSSMFILLHIGLTYWFATFFGNFIGGIVSYHLNRSFTFQSNTPLAEGAFKFIIVIFFSYLFSYSVSAKIADWFLTQYLFSYYLSKEELAVVGGAMLYTITNYLGQKTIVFNKRK